MHRYEGMHSSIAERITFGTPLDPAADDMTIHVVPRATTALIGRILLSVIFIVAGFSKLSDPSATIGYMNSAGVPAAGVLVYIAGLAELLGGLAILFGFLTRLAALGLMISVAITTYYFHAFWNMTGDAAKMQMVQFTKNLAILGGLAAVMAFGAGPFSLDKKMRRPIQA